ncbi:hypothetical protein U472_10190 [Orenia metallireducens]|uniref:histidine kinase n=1 Tax=Orenia metallireducens TaxID=1413210 RepID=A0A1C0A7Y8_9FIRM|nr:HAMP domain-containing sensor histidine kinase [Orenia metallireducens]OCL26366.1 hypothetical protein U472_10190 [Orenia metallireducens]
MEEVLIFLINNFPGLAIILDDEYRIQRGNKQSYDLYKKVKGETVDPHQLRNQDLSNFHPLGKVIGLKALSTGKPNYGYIEYNWGNMQKNILYCDIPAKLKDGSQGVVVLNFDFPKPIKDLKGIVDAFYQNYDIYFSQLEISLFDTKGKVLYVNKAVLDNAGLENDDELLGENLFKSEKSYISKENGNSILGDFISKGDFLHTKLYISKESKINNGCQSRVLEVICFPIEIESHLLGSICIGMNLGQISKYSNQVKQFERLENIREMAFRVIHEIRNPLQEILAVAELGKIKSNQDEIESYFEHIKSGISWINDLLNDIVQISDPSSLSLEEVELDIVCQEILDDISKNYKDICWEFSIESMKTVLDKDLFKEIIIHLVDNAIDALANKAEEKKITINSSLQGGDILFSIYNSGNKIPERIQDSIFDPFTSTKGNNGTGLGLTVVYYIITKVYQGDIWFESNDDGTTFFFKIKRYTEKVKVPSINNTDYKGIK